MQPLLARTVFPGTDPIARTGTKKKRPAPAGDGAGSTSAAPAQKKGPAYSSPYHIFCQEQRPLVPLGMSNAVREKHLGQRWKALPFAEREKYKMGMTPLPTTGRGGKRAWVPTASLSASAPPLPSATPSPALLPTTTRSNGSDIFSSAAAEASVSQGGAHEAFVTQGRQPSEPTYSTSSKAVLEARQHLERMEQIERMERMEWMERMQRIERQSSPSQRSSRASQSGLEQLEATLPVEQRATFWAARTAETSPPFDPALLHQGRQHAHSAPLASIPPLPAVEQAVAQQTEEGDVGGGDASEGELEGGRHAEGGYSDGELNGILQEQLARLRSSWSHECS